MVGIWAALSLKTACISDKRAELYCCIRNVMLQHEIAILSYFKFPKWMYASKAAWLAYE